MWTERFAPRSRVPGVVFVIGTILFVVGLFGSLCDVVSGVPVAGLGLGLDLDLEVAGFLVGVTAVVGGRYHRTADEPHAVSPPVDGDCGVYVTRSLLETLLDRACEHEPSSLSIGLGVTPAGRLDVDELDPDLPVFTHFYFPVRSNSISSVFGIDLQIPPGRTQGRFVSHPRSGLELTKRDDLHTVVIVAVPPWDSDSAVAFDRRGRRHPLRVVDATPPEESVPR